MAEQTSTATQTKARILLVDDDPIILDSLSGFLTVEGYEVAAAATVTEAIRRLEGSRFNLVITDVSMPDRDGFELLRVVRESFPEIVIILITGYGTVESAVEAIKQGAYDYLTKPIIDDDVRLSVERALRQQHLVAENRRLKSVLSDRYSFAQIVGQDYRMLKLFDLIDAVADSTTNVLITGESGTGKSLIAQAIHSRSPRRDKPFVEVSCGALPDTLLQSELFGHVRRVHSRHQRQAGKVLARRRGDHLPGRDIDRLGPASGRAASGPSGGKARAPRRRRDASGGRARDPGDERGPVG